jgi:hypothetical protein
VCLQQQGTTGATIRNTTNIYTAITRNNNCNIGMKQLKHHEHIIATTNNTTKTLRLKQLKH